MHRATALRGPLEPTDDELWTALDEEHKWATAAVSRDRLIELNGQAASYFTDQFSSSWAPDYLQRRLGSDLSRDDRFTAGYAPGGWTNLTRHLHQLGATDQEILSAGLGRLASTGRIVDQFRDRLVFPIHGPDGEIHGFIGRRNPRHDSDDGTAAKAGPKYLNTRRTDLFDKGAQLFGQHEGRHALSAGAVPVLVEGPLDAIAITLVAPGTHVGVAPLGTAFTDRQADQLAPYIGDGKPGVVVATDADLAGWKAAQRAYWQLTARGANPMHVVMNDDADPATILETGGPVAIYRLLAGTQPLARSLIDDRAGAMTDHDSTDHRTAADQIARVIAALPPSQWQDHIDYAIGQLDTNPGALRSAVIDAADAWTNDPRSEAQQRIRSIGSRPRAAIPTPTSQATEDPDLASARGKPPEALNERWRTLANQIDPRLPHDEGWTALLTTLDRVAAHGMAIEAELPRIAAEGGPLPARRTAQELQYRVIAASDVAIPSPAPQSPEPVDASRTRPETPPRDSRHQDRQSGLQR